MLWGLPFRLSASSWSKWGAPYPDVRTSRLRTAISTVRQRGRTGVDKDATSWLRSRGRRFVLGPIPPAGPAQETRRESQEPGLPGPAAPQRRPSSPVLDCRKPAGGNALPGGWERPRARRPCRLPRPAAARSCHCGKRASPRPTPLSPARAPGAACPLASHGSAAAADPWPA